MGSPKRITVNGLGIEYEVIGTGDPLVVTPGGRFSKETPGVRELAEALAREGKQVLIIRYGETTTVTSSEVMRPPSWARQRST